MIHMKQDVDSVRVSFENEKQQKPVRVDMVIGADGIHSTVVKQIFSQTAPSIHSKENILYGVIDNIDEQISINPSITAKNTLTQYFDRREFISYQVGNQRQLIWAATYPSDEPPAQNGHIEWIEINNQRELNRFLTRFPSSHPVHQCAAATNEQEYCLSISNLNTTL